jgi:anti-sigma-K factor RskA
MTTHEWFIERRVEYATGTLGADEARSFETHVRDCGECRAEIARIEHDLRWLPLGAAPVAPRAAFHGRAVGRALAAGRSRPPRWAVPAALAASALLAVGGWWLGRAPADALRQQLRAERAAAATLRDTLSIMRAGRVLQASLEVDGTRGGILIFADEVTHRWNVVIHGLPPAPAGHRYQFWFVCADGSDDMVRGTEVAADARRPTMFTTGMPQPQSCPTVKGAALTEEPMPDVAGPPRGKPLAHLML